MVAKPLIAVDALAIGTRGKGAARVLVNLLARLPSADSQLDYVALATDEGAVEIRRKAPAVDVLVLATPRSGTAWEMRGVAHAATLARADLIFTVREIVPSGGPPVCLHVFEPPIYRLRGFRPRDMVDARRLAKDVLLSALFAHSVRRAHTVTAGSEATAAWLLRHARRGAEVVLPGIDPVFFGTADQVVSEPYVLHPASGDARENTDLVLQAFGTGGLAGIRLVLVGTPESVQRRIGERAKQLGVSVELPGWVTDERLRELYRGAVAVVTPSRYEGYAGYPALEAMALGTPVVAIEAPGVTEALRGRGILLSEPDPVLLAGAIRRLQQDDALRRELGESGRVHARSLTWDASAAKFAAVFRQALQSRA